MALPRFARYLIVGSVVGISAVLFRELLALLMPAQHTGYYLFTVVVTYAVAIVASYLLQRLFTFNYEVIDSHRRVFVSYIVVALIGGSVTSMLSVGVRALLLDVGPLAHFADTLAFIVGALGASVVTYLLNLLWVFRRTH
ncbi:GtrA family protein [Aestuariirhabdus sp. LZHN29]|uniref:GtrA family protein n=1 Tax=Aestuariirhabdus sp. LZHN29 TaxID=3417462 RepID=UPI003CF96BB0